ESLLSLLMYHRPQKEKLWTGDIFQTGKADGRDIAIVVTPACDLAQDKTDFVTVALGFKLTPEVLTKSDSILFQRDETLQKLVLSQKDATTDASRRELDKKIKERTEFYSLSGRDLPAWAHILHHVDFNGKMLPICLDLNDLERVRIKTLEEATVHGQRV